MNAHRRTKIVATIGPATRSVEGMVELIEAGADVFRFNFSHGTRDDHAENVTMAREAAERSGKEVGILGDLPGPEAADRRRRRTGSSACARERRSCSRPRTASAPTSGSRSPTTGCRRR